MKNDILTNQERITTTFDRENIDIKRFAKQQMEFYRDVKQHIYNLKIDIAEIGADIEDILYRIESESYKTMDSCRVFKELKLLRNMKRSKERELECCIQMTRKIDCDRLAKILENSYSKVFVNSVTELKKAVDVA
ncbi:MAG: hypothetical protein E7257_00430 [Lachnospiraceae bacterium]|nr:hypothetical protein [Lachnospiraceae bacterium]MBQ9936217.1 hypothetical protein [Lachnospiraceae bacterium]